MGLWDAPCAPIVGREGRTLSEMERSRSLLDPALRPHAGTATSGTHTHPNRNGDILPKPHPHSNPGFANYTMHIYRRVVFIQQRLAVCSYIASKGVGVKVQICCIQ